MSGKGSKRRRTPEEEEEAEAEAAQKKQQQQQQQQQAEEEDDDDSGSDDDELGVGVDGDKDGNSPVSSDASGGATLGSNGVPPLPPAPPSSSKYNYAVVCSSNVNRSMEAHVAFFNNKLRVGSYGAGRFVRLPVPGSFEGRSFAFGTPYDDMLKEFEGQADAKTQEFYRRTKLLDILRRNGQIKTFPERWQDADFEVVAGYDVVLCFEQRIFDAVIEDLQSREARDLEPICVICMETKDDPKEAVVAGRAAVKLAQKVRRGWGGWGWRAWHCVGASSFSPPSHIACTVGGKRRPAVRRPGDCGEVRGRRRPAVALPDLLPIVDRKKESKKGNERGRDCTE